MSAALLALLIYFTPLIKVDGQLPCYYYGLLIFAEVFDEVFRASKLNPPRYCGIILPSTSSNKNY